jgi:hypothetical protein
VRGSYEQIQVPKWGSQLKSERPNLQTSPLSHLSFVIALAFGFWHLKFGAILHLLFGGIFGYNTDNLVK